MIYYFAPTTPDEPVGGLHTICDHVECLNEIAGTNIAAVISDNPFLKKWFPTKAPVISPKDINIGKDDTVVIAEITPEEVQRFNNAGRKLVGGLNWSLVKQFITKEILEMYGYEGIIANSQYSVHVLSGEYSYLKIYYIPNFIDSLLFRPDPDLPRDDNTILIFPRKNMKHINDIIDFVRKGGYKAKITLIDRFHQTDLPRIYSSHDIFISIGYPEGFPRPPIEALLCECVLVGFTGGGGSDYMIDGVNCLTAQDGDIQVLLSKLKFILNNPKLKERLRSNTRASVLKFTKENSKTFLSQVFSKELCNIHIEKKGGNKILSYMGERYASCIEEDQIDDESFHWQQNDHIVYAGAVVRGKNAEVENPNDLTDPKDGRLSQLEGMIGDKEKQIASIGCIIKAKEFCTEHLETIIREKEAIINHIYNSHGWKFLLRYYRVRDKILPINTKRELLAKLFFKAVTDPKGILSNFKKIYAKKLGCHFRTSKPAISEKEMGEKILGVSEVAATHPVEESEGRDDLTPPGSMIFVGEGDFKAVGEEFRRYFLELGRLKPEDRVLDVGCGIGRMAVPLTLFLSPRGEYWGFDIVRQGIEWCQSHIAERYGNFHFLHCDVYNEVYNPSGRIPAKNYGFPFEDDSFDFVFLTSVFTHMLPRDMENYLSEVSRVMKPGGRCLLTFFLITNQVRNLIDMGLSTLDFKYVVDGCLTTCKEVPEGAIAYNQKFILNLFKKYNLRIGPPIHYGSWCGRSSFLSYQDIIVATRE